MRVSLSLIVGITLLASQAYASPMLSISVFDNGVQIGSTVNSTTGSISFLGTDASFSDIQVSGEGVPILANPDLSTTTLEATASAGFTGKAVLEVDITQTGLTPFTGKQATTGTYNALVGFPGPATENMFVDGALIVTNTMVPPVNAFGPVNTNVVGLTSDEEQYLLTFSAAGQSSSGTMQFVASSVPEPPTWTLFVLGSVCLFAWGLARERRWRLKGSA